MAVTEPPRSRSVLILTAGFGEGHNAAARNLQAALLAADPAARVALHDIFLEAYGWLDRLSVRGYLFLINRLPGAWNLVFQWLDRSSAVAERISIFGRAARHLQSLLADTQPDVIVSTYPGNNHLLDHLHIHSRRPFIQITIVTDSLTVNRVWHTGHSDWYVVANEATAEVMRRQGVPGDKLRVLGFPVPAFFAEARPPKAPPTAGKPWRVLFMVNSGKRIAVEAVTDLQKIEEIELSVTVGRDEALEHRIRALGGNTRVYGWTKELPRLMADAHIVVSKAGGATVQECLAACSPMIVSQVVPGQEEGNARLIAGSESGVIAETPEAIAQAVREALANGGATWSKWHAATQRLSRPHAAREIAEWILEMGARDAA